MGLAEAIQYQKRGEDFGPPDGVEESRGENLRVHIEALKGDLSTGELTEGYGPDGPELAVDVSEADEEKHEVVVRGATINDLGGLVQLELRSYLAVYGRNPDEAVIDQIEDKYRQRIDLLGDWVRVMEHPAHGIFGMLVICPTSKSGEDFEGVDMTSTEGLEQALDPSGTNAYIINMSVVKPKGLKGATNLLQNTLEYVAPYGIETVFFESRMPGFSNYVRNDIGLSDKDIESKPDLIKQMAQDYVRIGQQPGTEKAQQMDKLMRFYSRLGAKPIAVVKNAWSIDQPSLGYGVLCQLEIPKLEERITDRKVEISEEPADEELLLAEVPLENAPPMWRRLVKRVGVKRASLIASGLGVMGYEFATNDMSRLVHEAAQTAPWALPAYFGSLAVYVSSMGYTLSAAAVSKNPFKFGSHIREVADKVGVNKTIYPAFVVNRVSAVGAAGVAAAGIIEVLPPSGWSALVVPAVDIAGTWALGRPINQAFREKRQGGEQS